MSLSYTRIVYFICFDSFSDLAASASDDGLTIELHHLVTCVPIPFLKQVVRNIVPVTERLDALVLRIGLTLVANEKPLKIFTAVYVF